MKTYLPISIIIPTLNRPKTLRHTLVSYISSGTSPKEIIVIDQSNNNQTKKIVDDIKAEYPKVRIKYAWQETPSSTLARNTGMDLSEEDILVFSDDDIEADASTLLNVYEHFKDPQLSMIGGLNDNAVGGANLYSPT